jgi:hypothetical protein
MVFTLAFVMWTAVLAAAWWGPRRLATWSFGLALALTIALFVHHVTDPLTLSF